MVNSGSFDSDGQGDRNAKVGFTQPHNAPDSTQSSSPVTASAATPCKTDFSQTADSDLPSVAHAIEPTPTKTEFNSDMPVEKFTNLSSVDGTVEESGKLTASPSDDEKTSLCCSLPLDKVQGVLTPYHPPATKADDDGTRAKQPVRKLLCLYCDRSFVSANLRQKHVERIHSARQNRRVSSRRQNQLTVTPCVYCDKLNGAENTLKDLFHHLVNEHSNKYFGCLPCEDRFLTSSLLADHNASNHATKSAKNNKTPEKYSYNDKTAVKTLPLVSVDKLESEDEDDDEIPIKITRSKMRSKSEEENEKSKKPIINKKKSTKLKELRAKKLSVKSSRIALKRRESKRLQAIAKISETQKKKRPKPSDRKQSNVNKMEQANSTKSTEKIKSNPTCINPYPEFDHFYRVKKITDHSIDNLKISSLTFDDVFDKAFFNRIKCNIEENLLHHIDGKLFKNEESESRISNFEKVSNVPQEVQNTNSENYGCELSLNAVTPVASLSLNSQFGEDFESQIEYGSKPSKKKTQTRKDEVHYKYFTRRKYQASILEHKENRDLSKLDMWTQLVIKKRQQKMLDDKKSAKEIQEYTTCDEYKNKIRREELNRILDRRGPFEDLKEEASKKAALDKLNLDSADNISQESFTEVREVLNEILNRVFAGTEELYFEIETTQDHGARGDSKKQDVREIPSYLNLRRSSSLPSDGEIDKSDRIALICSSQETENFELPTNQVRGKNELIELTGEWARSRMYICAACGAKLPNMKFLLEHKSIYHQNVWVQHYEFVGNQSELYRHLSIPALGKVGAVEESVQCKVWRRSDARVCTKCGKQCNALAELHRHILECGGDWTWMLARKKCKYRPFGAKSRRKRRGLIHRIHHKRKTEPTEKKTYKKRFDGPRQRPSDADTIQRMLANLPAKRSTRKLISLYDGIYRARKSTQININQKKVKCGKVIYKTTNRKDTTEKTINTSTTASKSQKNNLSSNRRSMRTLNKVLASRILDTNTKLNVKRKLKVLNDQRRTRRSQQEQPKKTEEQQFEEAATIATEKALKDARKENKEDTVLQTVSEITSKRTSPRSSPQNVKKKMTVKKLLTGNISIKSFFPVKKRKHKKDATDNQGIQEITLGTKNIDIKTRSKRKSKEIYETAEEKKDEVADDKAEPKKTKNDTFSNLVRSLSFHNKRNTKGGIQSNSTETSTNNGNTKKLNIDKLSAVAEEKEEVNAQKFTKKRKLKRSFRTVINKVKKIKTENSFADTEERRWAEPANTELPRKPNEPRSAFLEESKRELLELPAQAEKIVTPSTLEVKENIADISTPAPIVINYHDSNENPPIPETIFKLESNNEKHLQAKGAPDFDSQPLQSTNTNKTSTIEYGANITNVELTSIEKRETNGEIGGNIAATDKTQPISIETSVKPKVVPLVSPNMKGKIRKPTRGLNDCIAMLTSKLQQKTVEETVTNANNIFNLLEPHDVTTPEEIIPPKTECILRIPKFKSQTIYPSIEETALDLSTKYLNSEIRKETATTDLVNKLNDPDKSTPYNSVDQTIEEVVENRIRKLSVIPRSNWSSVDETIQKVIENAYALASQLPTKNTIDEIIDFVVGYENQNYSINEIKSVTEDDLILNKIVNKSTRKIGAVRRTNKKSVTESLKLSEAIEGITPNVIATVIKEKVLTSLVAAEKMFIDNLNSESISCKKNLKDNVNIDIKLNQNNTKVTNAQDIGFDNQINNPTIIINRDCNVENLNAACAVPKEETLYSSGIKDIDDENPESVLNKAFIKPLDIANGKNGPLKSKKVGRKVGQVRNRSRSKKGVTNTSKTEKNLLETNFDTISDVKEINPRVLSPNRIIGKEPILTKDEEIKQLLNEDEPLLLENKVMTPPRKPNTLPSDSEDDIPLAALVKPEDCTVNKEITTESNINNETPLIAINEKISDNAPQDAITLDKTAEENTLSDISHIEHTAITTKKVKGRPKSVKKSNEKLLPANTKTISPADRNRNAHDKTFTEREYMSLEDLIASPIENNAVKAVNEKETKDSRKKKVQKRKSRSIRRKVNDMLQQPEIMSNTVDLEEKLDNPTVSDTPLSDILKEESLEKLNTTSIKQNLQVSLYLLENENDDSGIKSDGVSDSSTDLDTSSSMVSNDLSFCNRVQKRRSRSLKTKRSTNSKVTDTLRGKTNIKQVNTEPNLVSTDTKISLASHMEEENCTTTTNAVSVNQELSESLTGAAFGTNRKEVSVDKNHESSSDLDSDTPLTIIIAGKRLEENIPPSTKLDEKKEATPEVDADSDTPLTMIINDSSPVDKMRKRKSRSAKRKTETTKRLTKELGSSVVTVSPSKKTIVKNKSEPNSFTDEVEENIKVNIISDNLHIESELENTFNKSISDTDKNNQIPNVEKTEIGNFSLEPTIKKNVSKRPLKKTDDSPSEYSLSNDQLEHPFVVNLVTKTLEESIKIIDDSVKSVVNATKTTKRKSKSLKKKQNRSTKSKEFSSLSSTDSANVVTANEGEPNLLPSQLKFEQSKIDEIKLIRKRSIITDSSSDDFSTDSPVNDSLVASNELSQDFKGELIETSSQFTKSPNVSKKKTRAKRNTTLSSEESISDNLENENHSVSLNANIDMSLNIKNEIQNLALPHTQISLKKTTKRSKSKGKPLDNFKEVIDEYTGILNKFDENFAVDNEALQSKELGIKNTVAGDLMSDLTPLDTDNIMSPDKIDGNTNSLVSYVRTKNKRSRSVRNKSVTDSVDETTAENCDHIIESSTDKQLVAKSGPKKVNRKGSLLSKVSATDKVEQLALTANSINILLTKINDDPNVNLEVRNKNRKGRLKSVTNASRKMEDGKSNNDIKPKLKRRQSLRNSQKEKNKQNNTVVSNIVEPVESLNIISHNINVDTNNSPTDMLKLQKCDETVDLPLDKVLESTVTIEKIDENTGLKIPLETTTGTFQEPSIKLVINKQKTRRKSKSFKKVDLKGQNDLFEDFALVIKKPKRIVPMITYAPADSFAKDIYPKYIKQPVEQLPLSPLSLSLSPLPLPRPTTAFMLAASTPVAEQEQETAEITADLDASVEEMDMELDEIPIISNIIERDCSSFTPPFSTTNVFSKETIDLPETASILENTNEKQTEDVNQLNDKEITQIQNSLNFAEKDITVEEILDSPETDFLLNTEEESLYETCTTDNIRSDVFSTNVQDLKTCKKSKKKPKNRTRLGDSLEVAKDMNNFDLEGRQISGDLLKENISSMIKNNAIKIADNSSEFANKSDFVFDKKQKLNIAEESFTINKTSDELEINETFAKEQVDLQKSNAEASKDTETIPNINDDRSKKNKRKKTKCIISANDLLEEATNIKTTLMVINKETTYNKEKDIENIYTFTELEDLEIEKPIEIPRRVSKKQPKAVLEPDNKLDEDNLTYDVCDVNTASVDEQENNINKESNAAVEEPIAKPLGKRRSRSARDIFILNSEQNEEGTGEIKENSIDVEVLENGRKKSVRSAKVKALEHIHDDALAELTESERNRELNRDKLISSAENVTSVDEITKKSNRRQSRAPKAQKILECTELPNEIDDKLGKNLEELRDVGLEKSEIYAFEEDINTSDASVRKRSNRRQSKGRKASQILEDTTKNPTNADFGNLKDPEKDIKDKVILTENKIISNGASKRKGTRRQSKSQKPQVDLREETEKSTLVDDLEKEPINDGSELKTDIISSEDETVPLDNIKEKPNKKGKAQKVHKASAISELLKSVEEPTLVVDSLTELEKTIENELDKEAPAIEEADSEELGNKELDKKSEQIKKNQKLLDNFDSSSEIAQKCAELIDFADNIAGLEELENSIERELNLEEIETRKKAKQSKNKLPAKLVDEQNENMKNDFLIEDNFQELRRSRRGSRKITSYNENDLIDPLLDEVDGKRKNRKKERAEENIPDGKVNKKSKESEKKLNSDELFDLLKASTTENKHIPKVSNSLLNNLEEDSSKDFHDNFNNVFDNILEKSFLMQNTLADKSKDEKDIEKIYEFTESPENTEHLKGDLFPLEAERIGGRKLPRRNTSPSKPQSDENTRSTLNVSGSENLFPGTNISDSQDTSVDGKNKNSKSDKTDISDKSNYCEICNKSFIRVENLIKHKRTLTHIQKLSEIEAKEAAERLKLESTREELSKTSSVETTTETSKATCDISRNEINISDILQDSNKPNGQESPIVHSSFANNHSLKLADIINDVLNKPVLEGDIEKHNSFSDIIMQNNTAAQPEYRRYKSLGERKSFDSEPTETDSICMPEPYMSKTTILEKQISLLENIIENQTGVNYIDDISMSSNNSLGNNTESPSELSMKQDDSSNIPYNTSMKPTSNNDSFLKPSQYEEISEDSINVRNYEDQKLRKTLNRDEELFLECCSLLKSGSEVSSYSNKKAHSKILNNMGLKQCDEPEWLERKSLVQKPMYNAANDYSDDNSRIPTPLGDSYDDDASNSNTISSNWNMTKKVPVSEDKQEAANKSFTFEEVLNECVENHNKEINNTIHFGRVINQTKSQIDTEEMNRMPFIIDVSDEESSEKKQEDFSDASSTSDSKKIITKGARKIFEGLKVSIPTEELNLDEVFNCSPKQKKVEAQNLSESTRSDEPTSPPAKPSRTARKSKPVKNKSQVGGNVLFKMNKKKVLSPTTTKKREDDIKSHDIYDFEETQDNTDVFTKPDFKTFRNMKSNEPIPEPESDTESHDYLDTFSVGAPSVTSSISSSSSKKPKTQENITKKKCMIMGRIFKNQAKSKLEDIDEEMRHIPEINNTELVENYVADCKKIIRNEDVAKPKLSETEINELFDQLLEKKFDNNEALPTETKATTKSKPDVKKADNKKKVKQKNRKRTRTNSDSTDDEFNINKVTKKRAYRKNGKAEDNCINLEQELKECIGVASRKSQRKCTSGKQNVLVEYWSSDESQFEALLETQRIETKLSSKPIDESKEQQQTELPCEIPEVPIEEILVEVPKPTDEIVEKPHKPKSTDKKLQQKRKSIGDNKPKSVGNATSKAMDLAASNRRKRAAANPLYHWSSSSEDESQDLIEVKPIRDELEDDEDRPVQHGWIVGDSPKKLVTMLAQAKGKKTDIDCVKEQGKKRTNAVS